MYNFISQTNNQVILYHFVGEITGGSLNLPEEEIEDSCWVDVPDLLKYQNNELREAKVLKQIANNLLKGNIHSLTIFNEKL